jgi:hypothetical protein
MTAALALPLAAAPAHADTTPWGQAKRVDNSIYGADPEVPANTAPASDPSSLYSTDRMIEANQLWAQGITGKGVDVAVLDSGVSPVAGLDAAGKIVYGPDLSFDGQDPATGSSVAAAPRRRLR